MNEAHTHAHDFLESHTLAVLSTSTKDGKPWGSAIYYTVDKSFTFFFMMHTESQKYVNIRENPQIALTIANNEEQTTVQASGIAQELDETSEESAEAFRQLAAIHPPGQLSWTPPVSKMTNGKIVICKLKPESLQYSRFNTAHRPPKADVIQLV